MAHILFLGPWFLCHLFCHMDLVQLPLVCLCRRGYVLFEIPVQCFQTLRVQLSLHGCRPCGVGPKLQRCFYFNISISSHTNAYTTLKSTLRPGQHTQTDFRHFPSDH